MKASEKWVNEEANTLEIFMEKIILNHEKKTLEERRKYDIKLAYFIKEKYDVLS